MKSKVLCIILVMLICLTACAPAGSGSGTETSGSSGSSAASGSTSGSATSGGSSGASSGSSGSGEASGSQSGSAQDPSGSGSGSEDPHTPPENVDLEAIRSAMMEHVDMDEALELNTEALENLYNIDPAWVKSSASFAVNTGAFADEIVMTEAVDEDAAQKIAAALRKKLDSLLVTAKDYEPESYAIAKRCSVTTDGLYVSLIFSEQLDLMTSIYAQYMR